MKKVLKLAVFLGVICALASSSLYFVNRMTAPVIAANNKENTDRLLKEVASDADSFKAHELKEGSIVNYYVAKKDNKDIAWIYEVSTYGFQSDINVLLGIDKKGEFIGFQVVDQAETPGYGTQIVTSKKYQKQFTSKNIKDEIDTIAGSTISTEALKNALMEAVEHFQKKVVNK